MNDDHAMLGKPPPEPMQWSWRRKVFQPWLGLTKLNGEWALLRYLGDALDSVQMFELREGRVARMRLQRNPEKLVHLVHLVH